MDSRPRNKNVFINCPFDAAYKPIFLAIVFAVYDLGFIPRCAMELDDAGEVRLAKIVRIIAQCPFGIHDLSAVALTPEVDLPRFNMPFELGLYLGCKFFGSSSQRAKGTLILDSIPYRYQASISDVAGQDIHVHHSNPDEAIGKVRDWLANVSGTRGLPGGTEVSRRYDLFTTRLPRMCLEFKREQAKLSFSDFSEMVELWLNSEI